MAGKWRYGLVLHINEKFGNWYGVHSVYPDENSGKASWSSDTVKLLSDDPFDIPQELEMIKRDIEIHPVLIVNGNDYVETLPLAEAMEKYGPQSDGSGLNNGDDDI